MPRVTKTHLSTTATKERRQFERGKQRQVERDAKRQQRAEAAAKFDDRRDWRKPLVIVTEASRDAGALSLALPAATVTAPKA